MKKSRRLIWRMVEGSNGRFYHTSCILELNLFMFEGHEFAIEKFDKKWNVIHVQTGANVLKWNVPTRGRALTGAKELFRRNLGQVPEVIERYCARNFPAIDYQDLLLWNIL